MRTLKRGERGAFAKALRESVLADKSGAKLIPLQTQALARIWWPLMLSTNYDNCYAAAFHKHFPDRDLAVVGRGAEDCQRVLTSLSTAGRSLLWALQGYLHDVPHNSFGASHSGARSRDAARDPAHRWSRRVPPGYLPRSSLSARLCRSFPPAPRSLLCSLELVSRKTTFRSCSGRCWSSMDRACAHTMRSSRRARSILTSCCRASRSSSVEYPKDERTC